MRTAEQDQARWTWYTARTFGQAIGTGEGHVRELIADGWFRIASETPEGEPPEILDVSREGAKRPEYRISQAALDRYWRERSTAARAS